MTTPDRQEKHGEPRRSSEVRVAELKKDLRFRDNFEGINAKLVTIHAIISPLLTQANLSSLLTEHSEIINDIEQLPGTLSACIDNLDRSTVVRAEDFGQYISLVFYQPNENNNQGNLVGFRILLSNKQQDPYCILQAASLTFDEKSNSMICNWADNGLAIGLDSASRKTTTEVTIRYKTDSSPLPKRVPINDPDLSTQFDKNDLRTLSSLIRETNQLLFDYPSSFTEHIDMPRDESAQTSSTDAARALEELGEMQEKELKDRKKRRGR